MVSAAADKNSITSASTDVLFVTVGELEVIFKVSEMEAGAGPFVSVASAEIICSSCNPWAYPVYRWTPGSGRPVDLGGYPGGLAIPGNNNPDNTLYVMLPGARE